MANVVQRFDDVDIETGMCRHIKAGATFIGSPCVLALQADTAFAAGQFHGFRCAGCKSQRGWQNDAQCLFSTIGKQDSMGYTFTVEVDVAFFQDRNIVELCAHD